MRLRLLTSSHWWYAHRAELPDFRDCLLTALLFALAFAVCQQYETYQLRTEALFVQRTAGKFKRCMEGREPLGSEVKEDGKVWDLNCQEVWIRRMP